MAAETETIKDFLVKLGFDIDERSLGTFVEGISSATMRAMAFGTAITAAAAEVVHSVHEIAQENVQLSLLAKELNTTANAVDDFIDTADMLGISNETATNSLKNFSRNVQDAAMGIGRAKMVFEKLNIAVKDASGHARAATDVMADLQSKMEGMDRAKQLRIMERLGLDPKMLIMFNDAFGKTQYIGEELGKIDVASGFNLDKSIEQSKQFNKTWKEMTIEFNLLHMLFSKMYEAIAVQLMPSIQSGIKKVTQAITDARHEIMDNAQKIEGALKPIIEVVLRIGSAFVQLAVRAFGIVMDVISPIISTLLKINDATDGWAGYILAALAAWKVFNLGFLATPLGMILGLGVGILALIDDFRTFEEGGKPFFSFWGKLAPYIHTVINFLKEFGKLGATIFVDIIKGVYDLITAIAKLMGMGLDKIFGAFKVVANIVSPQAPAVSKGGSTTVNHQTTVNVNGAGNPQAVAQAVANQQHSISQQTARNLRGAVR
ncbi:MAG TPA: phage tail tape measure protein [Methanosarcina sp.]|nr:phage tail tape measure protein [Methanosarcina sp.]